MPYFFVLLGQYVWRSEIYQEIWNRIRTYGEGEGKFSDTMSGLDDMPIYGRGTYGVCIRYLQGARNSSNIKLLRWSSVIPLALKVSCTIRCLYITMLFQNCEGVPQVANLADDPPKRSFKLTLRDRLRTRLRVL